MNVVGRGNGLTGKVVVVSGVGPGMGQHLAWAFGAAGSRVVVAARTESYVDELESQLRAAGHLALGVPTDITNPDDCEALVSTTNDHFGTIDCLIHNAYSSGTSGAFTSLALEDAWAPAFDVNVWGAARLTQAVVPTMAERRSGSIVFVNTMIQQKPIPGSTAYSASKGAVSALARTLASELGPSGIRVNSTYMGWMDGPAVRAYVGAMAASSGRSEAEVRSGIEQAIALRRIPTDEECAQAVLFLASDLACAITGASLNVNGGEVMS